MKIKPMKTLLNCIVCCGICIILQSGCATAAASQDPRVTCSPELSSEISVPDLKIVKDGTNFPFCVLKIQNGSSRTFVVEWRATWIDTAGLDCEGVTNTWQRVAIQPGECKSVRNTAMSKDADDVKINVRPYRR